jgi:hypothetical protein
VDQNPLVNRHPQLHTDIPYGPYSISTTFFKSLNRPPKRVDYQLVTMFLTTTKNLFKNDNATRFSRVKLYYPFLLAISKCIVVIPGITRAERFFTHTSYNYHCKFMGIKKKGAKKKMKSFPFYIFITPEQVK